MSSRFIMMFFNHMMIIRIIHHDWSWTIMRQFGNIMMIMILFMMIMMRIMMVHDWLWRIMMIMIRHDWSKNSLTVSLLIENFWLRNSEEIFLRSEGPYRQFRCYFKNVMLIFKTKRVISFKTILSWMVLENNWRNLNNKNPREFFSSISHKISMREVPTENFLFV